MYIYGGGGDSVIVEILQNKIMVGAAEADTGSTNPLTNIPYSSQYYDIKKAIDKIPASNPDVKKELGKLLDTNDVILLTGETGSGKSVRVPSLVLEHYGYNAQIVCTQPRTVNASNISTFVSKILDVKIGEEVGFKFKHNDQTSAKTKLLYATDGTIAAQQFGEQARGEELFGAFDVVIIDEAHERSIQIDFLLLFIKRYLAQRKAGDVGGAATDKPKKFIIMSATVELETFRKYFADSSIGEISISGRTYPVTQHFAPKPTDDYMAAIKEKVLDVVNGMGGVAGGKEDSGGSKDKENSGGSTTNMVPGDILVFLSSKREIDELVREINERLHAKMSKQVVAVPLYSGLTPEQQHLAVDGEAFKQKPVSQIARGSKVNETAEIKIVVSTEIAETGVTVDGVVYVIESGKALESTYDTTRREDVLVQAFIPKAAVKQRIGRAGRTRPGIAYHIYTEAEYAKFPDFKQPDIRTTNIDSELMKLLMFKGVDTVGELRKVLCEMIEPPSELQIKSTLRFLAVLNIISSDKPDGKITTVGECIYALRIDVQLALALLSAKNYKVPYDESLDVIAVLQTESSVSRWFVAPPMTDKRAVGQFRDFKKKYTSAYGDVFSLYRLYRHFQEYKLGADKRFVRFQTMMEVGRNRKGIAEAFRKVEDKCHLERLGDAASQMEKNIIQTFMQGYYNQTATLKSKKNVSGREVYVYQLDSPPAPELGKQTIEVEPGRDNTMSRLSKKIMYLGVSNINGSRRFNGIINITETDLLSKVEKMYMGGVERVGDKIALLG